MNPKLTMVLRIFLGLILLLFGLNKFMMFMEMPAPPPEAGAFFKALADTGYMMSLVALTEIAVGLMLLLNKWSKFALIVLFPISVNIVLFHVFLDPMGGAGAFLVAILNLVLVYDKWGDYKSLFN